jgi:ElaB/YqjD/DUF883 family membrane-anchored ribosome-binding protein
VSRHRSVDILRGYVRDAELFKDHARAIRRAPEVEIGECSAKSWRPGGRGIRTSYRRRKKDQLQGKAKRLEGALQDAYGQATETAADAAEVIRKSASGAEDFLRTTIEERPYTAAAVALGVGYLIGRFSRRENY